MKHMALLLPDEFSCQLSNILENIGWHAEKIHVQVFQIQAGRYRFDQGCFAILVVSVQKDAGLTHLSIELGHLEGKQDLLIKLLFCRLLPYVLLQGDGELVSLFQQMLIVHVLLFCQFVLFFVLPG